MALDRKLALDGGATADKTCLWISGYQSVSQIVILPFLFLERGKVMD